MHHNPSYGRSGTLQATALRCVMKDPPGSTPSFTSGALLRSATTLTQDDLHHKRTVPRRPDSLMEVKRKSDPSQESNKSFSIKDTLLSGDGLFARLGSGRSSQGAANTSSNAARNRKISAPSKISKSREKASGAKFYTPCHDKDAGKGEAGGGKDASRHSAPSNRGKDKTDAKSHTANKNEVLKTTSAPSRNWRITKSTKADSKATDTSKGTSKATHDPKDTHKAQDYAKAIAKELSEAKNGEKASEGDKGARGRKKSTRRKFFKSRPQCAGPDDGTTTEEEVDGGGGESGKKWTPNNSLRRHYQGGHSGVRLSGSGDPSHSDTELGKISASHSMLDGECGSVGGSSMTSERAIDVGRVGSWATSFEKLLEDPAGLHTFAEFLKKEYSHENIYFWTACERYKRLSSPEEMRTTARQIFERHLYSGAPEPVNVDSQARQDAQDGLHMPNESLFAQAQKQIFNLMKFDSYSRFLKSSLYQDCMSQEMQGHPLPYPGDDTLDPDLRIAVEDSHIKLKKSRSDADERRRKSLLPWNRKDRSKSKDRGEAEYRRRKKNSTSQRNASDSSSLRSDISGSRTSLNSSDLPLGRRVASRESLTSGDQGSLSGSEGSTRCRVFLPDLTNSVVALKTNESIHDLMTRVLERRGLTYSHFEVYHHKTDKILNKKDDSLTLGGTEVRLEQRVSFQLTLPTQKILSYYAKPTKSTGEVLKSILQKYGLKIDLLHIHKEGDDKMVNMKGPVTDIDNARLVVQTKEEVKEWGLESGRQRKRGGGNASLDEITNRVFEDLRNVKTDHHYDDMGVMDLDARSCRTDSSDKSSGILGGFSRRNSFGPEKDLSSSSSKGRKPCSSIHDNLALLDHHSLMSKRRGNTTMQTKQENDELYEGLKRAQRSRLDDQRGTEINFELPDFLKCDQPQDKGSPHHLAEQLLARLECTFPEGVVASPAGDYFSLAHPEVWGGLPSPPLPPPTTSANNTLVAADLEPDLDLDDFEDTLRGDGGVEGPDLPPSSPLVAMEGAAVPPRMPLTALPLSPPPLPPKPKVGGVRGPPPRPPSRQLHLLNPPPPSFPPPPPSSSNSEDEGGLCSPDQPPPLPPLHLGRQNHDKFNISFV